MRMDKLLANVGFGTRKEVKQLIKSGVVLVNNEIVKEGKSHVDPEKDTITVHGEQIVYKEFYYFMMNKPAGVISATEDMKDETVIDLLYIEDQRPNIFPVGRLDKDTEGLLLLTNDGQLAHQLLSPKKHVPKTYFVVIDGSICEEERHAIETGVQLDDGYVTKPAKLKVIKNGEIRSEVELTITEGKYHQVKRMFQAIGRTVVYLKRMTMGPLKLDEDLALGEYRELTEEEIQLLKGK
ncbi:pseudouridine synthase [Bacillus kwashiorkori]|uniref:pseudouridine synthase n=1 Tax=Bacillus kwashiorkori TaxID=1522318 RepID=UPI000785C2BB|nr:pseudouridine synthase [Bacillus kwashiorkori]